MTKTEEMTAVDIQTLDLVKQLVEGLVGVGDEEGLLLWKVVVDVANDLCDKVRFSGSWWADNDGEAGVGARDDGFDLRGGKADGVLTRLVDGVWALVGNLVGRDGPGVGKGLGLLGFFGGGLLCGGSVSTASSLFALWFGFGSLGWWGGRDDVWWCDWVAVVGENLLRGE